jgi:hypothetical protein
MESLDWSVTVPETSMLADKTVKVKDFVAVLPLLAVAVTFIV